MYRFCVNSARIDTVCWQRIVEVMGVAQQTRRANSQCMDEIGDVHLILFGDFKSLCSNHWPEHLYPRHSFGTPLPNHPFGTGCVFHFLLQCAEAAAAVFEPGALHPPFRQLENKVCCLKYLVLGLH